jgi:predicted GNAT superfamily acetyltransferase
MAVILMALSRGIILLQVRTTLTLDPDVAQLLEEEARRRRLPWKQVVNDAIRRGFAVDAHNREEKPYRVTAHRTTLRAGIDSTSFNRLAEELEDEATLKKLGRTA